MLAVAAVIAFGIEFILRLLSESWMVNDGDVSFLTLGLFFFAGHFIWDVYGERFSNRHHP